MNEFLKPSSDHVCDLKVLRRINGVLFITKTTAKNGIKKWGQCDRISV